MIFSIDVTYCSVFRKKLSWILEIQIKKQIEKSHEINFFFNNFHKHTPSNKKKLLILKQRNKARTKKNPQNPQYSMYFYFYSLHLFTFDFRSIFPWVSGFSLSTCQTKMCSTKILSSQWKNL